MRDWTRESVYLGCSSVVLTAGPLFEFGTIVVHIAQDGVCVGLWHPGEVCQRLRGDPFWVIQKIEGDVGMFLEIVCVLTEVECVRIALFRGCQACEPVSDIWICNDRVLFSHYRTRGSLTLPEIGLWD